MGKDEIESYDVMSLQREVSELKRHIDGKENVDPIVLDKILSLDLHVDPSLLSDSGQSKIRTLIGWMSLRPPVLFQKRSRKLIEAKQRITEFRDRLDELRFALEL